MTPPHHSELPRSTRQVRTRIRPEQWRPVPHFEGIYAVSDQGRVKRVAPKPPRLTGKIVRTRPRIGGRAVVTLYRGISYVFWVDALIAQAFGRSAVDPLEAAACRPQPCYLWLYEKLAQPTSLSAIAEPPQRGRQSRLEQSPVSTDHSEPDLNQLFRLDMLDQARSPEPEPGADLPSREPAADKRYLAWCNSLSRWLDPRRWRTSAKGWQYTNRASFNIVVYRHRETWAFRIVELQAGEPAEPSPVLYRDDGYESELAAMIGAHDVTRCLCAGR
jgi:hypothetical protein